VRPNLTHIDLTNLAAGFACVDFLVAVFCLDGCFNESLYASRFTLFFTSVFAVFVGSPLGWICNAPGA
jgi:hypothetical protein